MKLVAATFAFLVGAMSPSYALAADPLGVSTVAGTGFSGTGGDNSDATQSALKSPHRTAVDAAGNLYIADSDNNRIQKVDTTGAVTTYAGTGSSGKGADNADATQSALNHPYGVAVDTAGNIYIADTYNNRIQKVDTTGAVTTIAGTGSSGAGSNNADATQSALNQPSGLAADTEGNIYIADYSNHRIQRVDTTGAVTTFAGTGSSGKGGDNADATQSALNRPYGMAADAAGNLYIADSDNDRIQKVDTTGAVTTIAGTGTAGTGGDNADATQSALNRPFAVTVDGAGNIYIADAYNNRIQKVTYDTTDPTITAAATPSPVNIGQTVTLSYTCADTNSTGIDTCTATLDGTSASDGDTFTPTAGGTHTFIVIAIDNAGNTTTESITITVAPDTTDPTIAIADPGTTVARDIVNLGYTCTDNGVGASGIDTCAATLNGSSATNGDSLDTANRGSHTLVVTATDNAGNTATQIITITVIGKRELTGDYANATGTKGSIARLYMATFTRNPEFAGFAFWDTSQQSGTTPQQMANYFSASPEFAARYGEATNIDFVELMYTNVMGRTADTGGHAYWLAQLDGGMTQARMLLMFSESTEFKQITYSS